MENPRRKICKIKVDSKGYSLYSVWVHYTKEVSKMYALILNGKREFPLYNDKEAAEAMLKFVNQYGDGQGRKGYKLQKIA